MTTASRRASLRPGKKSIATEPGAAQRASRRRTVRRKRRTNSVTMGIVGWFLGGLVLAAIVRAPKTSVAG